MNIPLRMRTRHAALLAAVLSVFFSGAIGANAQSLVYSMETGTATNPDGFGSNGGAIISQDTIGATESNHSLKVTAIGGFVGALTTNLPMAIGNPPGVDYVAFDLTLPEFYSDNFAGMGVMIFGESQLGPGQQFGLQAQFRDFVSFDNRAAGTYKNLAIHLDSATNPITFTPNQSFNQIFGSGPNQLIPTGFEFFFNKMGFTRVTAYIDNVRVGSGTPPPPPPKTFSFEQGTPPDGFLPNGGGVTVTQDSFGATDGTKSLKIATETGATFVGAQTQYIPGTIGPAGIDHVLFDLTIAPGDQFTGNFADVGVIFSGTKGIAQTPVRAQFASFVSLEDKGPGTYKDLRISLDSALNPLDFTTESFNQIFGSGANQLSPSAFELFINKSSGAPLTVYIDNVRFVAPVPEPASIELLCLGMLVICVGSFLRPNYIPSG